MYISIWDSFTPITKTLRRPFKSIIPLGYCYCTNPDTQPELQRWVVVKEKIQEVGEVITERQYLNFLKTPAGRSVSVRVVGDITLYFIKH